MTIKGVIYTHDLSLLTATVQMISCLIIDDFEWWVIDRIKSFTLKSRN